MWSLWSEVAIPAFATLFVIIDPIGLVPLFLAITAGSTDKDRHRTARRATVFGFTILLVFAISGQSVLNFLGISLAAFRIAGGLLLFLMAIEMLFERRAARREKSVERSSAEHEETNDQNEDHPHNDHPHNDHPHNDQWVFPLGTPLIAGPGAIASIILLMGNAPQGISGQIVIIGVLFTVIALTLVMFLIAGRLGRYLSPTATRAMSRILGMILAALAVQFVLTGLSSAGFGG